MAGGRRYISDIKYHSYHISLIFLISPRIDIWQSDVIRVPRLQPGPDLASSACTMGKLRGYGAVLQRTHPLVARLWTMLCCLVPTEADCERVFSVAKHAADSGRTRLNARSAYAATQVFLLSRTKAGDPIDVVIPADQIGDDAAPADVHLDDGNLVMDCDVVVAILSARVNQYRDNHALIKNVHCCIPRCKVTLAAHPHDVIIQCDSPGCPNSFGLSCFNRAFNTDFKSWHELPVKKCPDCNPLVLSW